MRQKHRLVPENKTTVNEARNIVWLTWICVSRSGPNSTGQSGSWCAVRQLFCPPGRAAIGLLQCSAMRVGPRETQTTWLRLERRTSSERRIAVTVRTGRLVKNDPHHNEAIRMPIKRSHGGAGSVGAEGPSNATR